MTALLRLEEPKDKRVPLVFDSPHSGSDYPDDFGAQLPVDVLRRFEDPFVNRLFEAAPAVGAPLLSAQFPRTYIDVNRSLEDLDPSMIDGSWPYPVRESSKVERGIGLIWRRARQYGPIYDRQLTIDEVERRIEACWRPYHSAIAKLIDETHAAFGQSFHVNCHSMTSHGDDFTVDGPGQRPDFVLGDMNGTSCEPGMTDLVAVTLRERGYSVAVNFPYRGAELTAAYSDPSAGRHSLQIEVNQGLYLTTDLDAFTDGYDPLKKDLADLVAALASYAASRVKTD